MITLLLPTSRVPPPQSLRLSSTRSVSVPSISHRTHFQCLIVCARKRRRRLGFRRFATFLLNSLSLLPPHLQTLPQPLDLVITDLGGGGRGLGFWRRWGEFDGWRRKRNRVPILFFVCVILWFYGYCKVSGKQIETDKVLGVCFFGLAMLKQIKREPTHFVFGFLYLAASLVFGFKKQDLVTLASRIRSSSILFRERRRRTRD